MADFKITTVIGDSLEKWHLHIRKTLHWMGLTITMTRYIISLMRICYRNSDDDGTHSAKRRNEQASRRLFPIIEGCETRVIQNCMLEK